MENLKPRIKETIIDALMLDMAPGDIGDCDDLNVTLGIDSVGFLEILTALEDEFGIVVEDMAATRQAVSTIDDLAELVLQAKQNQS